MSKRAEDAMRRKRLLDDWKLFVQSQLGRTTKQMATLDFVANAKAIGELHVSKRSLQKWDSAFARGGIDALMDRRLSHGRSAELKRHRDRRRYLKRQLKQLEKTLARRTNDRPTFNPPNLFRSLHGRASLDFER